MTTENSTAGSLPNSGGWFDSASDAVRSGMTDAQKSAEQILPKIGSALSTGLFGLGYGVGYGLAFPAVLIAKVFPQENCVAWGLVDGAQVAYESAYQERRGK